MHHQLRLVATKRMVGALVGRLREPARGRAGEVAGRAFPTPAAMAAAGDVLQRRRPRRYHSRTLRGSRPGRLRRARREALLAAHRETCPTGGGATCSPPGVALRHDHVMMLLGRHSRLVLIRGRGPSTRALMGRPKGKLVADPTIRGGSGSGPATARLAFWLVLTRDWVDDPRRASGG